MRVAAKAKVTFSNRAWRELADNVNDLGRSHVKVGILAGKGADTPGDDTSLTLAQIAAIHEYGAPAANIPERSFLRRTFRLHSAALGNTTARLAKLVLARKLTNTAALNPDQEYLDEGYYFFVTGNPNGDHPGEYFYAKTADEHHQNCIIAGWG